MRDERRSLLLVQFERFVRAHSRCGAFVWEMTDTDNGFGVEVNAQCLRCDARFRDSASDFEVTSSLVHSSLLPSMN